MVKKLTITVEADVYERLHQVVGRGHISNFIEDLVRPVVMKRDLDAAYKSMGQDEAREREALEWTENLTGEIAHETR